MFCLNFISVSRRICHILIENGAETFCKDDVNWTPLDYAAQYGHSKVAKLLLDNDAPVDAVDKNGKTPLHHASMCGHIDCINLLLDNNASISHQNKDGKNCLDFAVENHERDACMAFIQHKRHVNFLTLHYKVYYCVNMQCNTSLTF